MIVWLILFLLVIGISFLLSLRSMKDFAEIPQKSKLEYSLYLIRKSSNLSVALLQSIHDDLTKKGLVVSLERLFKGSESALCIFGPQKILSNYLDRLDLMELLDYTANFNTENTTVWEVDFKRIDNPFSNLPQLGPDEKFCWQVLLSGKHVQIRAAVFSNDPKRRKELVFSKLPRPFSNDVLLELYKQRSMDKVGAGEFNAEAFLRLFCSLFSVVFIISVVLPV